MLLCAPIATRVRLTLYYQLEKICGRNLVTLYNLANGVMFCFLAGSMITVSATALGVWFDFPMPALSDIYPNSVGWVIAVVVVGALISVVAAYGYESVARFANLAAPWMVLVFLAFGIIGLRQFMSVTNTEVRSAGDLWNLFNTVIWKGGDPLPGQVKFTFWHVMFFAWFCNMAMHVGMADLTVFRYAKKSWYAIATAAGMYVGHFMAWLSASILYALQLHLNPSNTDVLPGPLAYQACGLAGLICVIVAGWTTANPTIYRAGLAFQAISPKSSRFVVTLLTGGVATLAGVFPGVAMKLLGFVALYGMILMPMGAVIFVDFWLFKRLGLKSNYAEWAGIRFNWAAGLTWFLTLAICVSLVLWGGIQLLRRSCTSFCPRCSRSPRSPGASRFFNALREVRHENHRSNRIVPDACRRCPVAHPLLRGRDQPGPRQADDADRDHRLVHRHALVDGPHGENAGRECRRVAEFVQIGR
jgi:purine-cytosine permease-like protein